jgi:hypothetical protein
VNPSTVFSASLLASLVLWLPSMLACLRGDLDLASAGLRYLGALVLARLVLGGLARLVNGYHSPPPPSPPPLAPGDRRRKEDRETADLPA